MPFPNPEAVPFSSAAHLPTHLLNRLRRVFDPLWWGNGVYIEPVHELRRLEYEPHSIVISIDGVCDSPGERWARASWAVFFARSSFRNMRSCVGAGDLPSYQTAQLQATRWALSHIEGILETGNQIVARVVLITSSKWLVECLVDRVWLWEASCWLDARGLEVGNRRLLQWCHERIGMLQDRGCEVNFWIVGDWWNQEATILARSALR